MAEKIMVYLTWQQCQLISHYYRFPTLVFLLTEQNMEEQLKGKREDKLLDRVARLEAILNGEMK